MAKKLIGNLDVTNNITSYGHNVVRSVNNKFADINGNVILSFSDLATDAAFASPGNMLITNKDNKLVPDDLIQYLRLCNNFQFNEEKTKIETWNTIFNTWKRFSHGNGKAGQGPAQYPSMESELTSWQYNASNQNVRSTINSETYLGFVSPAVYTRYNFEVQCLSTNADNDMNGIVIAYTELDNRQYTLSAVRVILPEGHTLPEAGAKPWAIVYNYHQPDQKIITQGNYNFTTSGGWSNYPSGVKIKVQRDGNIIKADTSDFADTSNAYISPLQVDLTQDPLLEKFIKPCACGYGNQSQNASSFVTLQFSGANTIYNYDTNQIWYYNFGTSSWILDTTQTVMDHIEPGYLYSNPNTCDMYTLHVPSGEIRRIAGTLDGVTLDSAALNVNGFLKHSSGFLECWGTVTNVTTSAPVTITMPSPYSQIFNIQCTVALKSELSNMSNAFGSYDSANNTITISTSSTTAVEIYYRVVGKS